LSSNSKHTATLLLAHGSPDNADEIPEYLRLVTSGRPLPQAVIDEITHRYSLVGFSPLTCWTLKQAMQLANQLNMPVHVGMRNWKPFISEAVATMTGQGVTDAICLCLAPQNSRTSVGLYHRAVEIAVNKRFNIDFVESWHDHPLLIEAFAGKFQCGWQKACSEAGSRVPVIFTAHSVPERTITEGDPYKAQAHETAELVARRAQLTTDQWTFAFQSQGMSGGPWIGPTVEDTILGLKERGFSAVFLQPIGFLCDHVEILYDIDMAFKNFAGQHGMRLWRADSLNDSLTLTSALADIVRRRVPPAN
jgi:ferrochelatase